MDPRLALVLLLAACTSLSAPRDPVVLPLPPRPRSAPTGSELAQRVRDLPVAERERILEYEFLSGNVPNSLRQLEPITVAATLDGKVHTVVLHVTPDYLAVGRDDDFLRIPLTATGAQRIADQLGCVLPTRKIVNDVHLAANVRIAPRPFHPDRYDITSVQVFEASNDSIESVRAGRSGVVSGIKKDIVISPAIASDPGHVVIYGWHREDGTPIQPLSSTHVASYVDYSHGVRLVHGTVRVDGEERSLPATLADPVLWPLVSDEGPVGSWRY